MVRLARMQEGLDGFITDATVTTSDKDYLSGCHLEIVGLSLDFGIVSSVTNSQSRYR